MRFLYIYLIISILNIGIFSNMPPSKKHHSTQDLNISLKYENIFESAWILSECDNLALGNTTKDEIWTLVMSEMSSAASQFFYLGNYTLDYKIEYIFNNHSSNYEFYAFFELVPWTLYIMLMVFCFISIIFCLMCCQVFCI